MAQEFIINIKMEPFVDQSISAKTIDCLKFLGSHSLLRTLEAGDGKQQHIND